MQPRVRGAKLAAQGSEHHTGNRPHAYLACVQARMTEARDLFRNEQSTEFVIVTIPTMMAVSESSRLAAALKKDGIPVNKVVVNQVRKGSE